MRSIKSKYSILLVLVIIFVCPGLVALTLYNHPEWLSRLSSDTQNKGHLLEKPEKLALSQSKPKWRFIVWNYGACTETCRLQVDKLARVRLALGRRLYQVDEILVLSEKALPLSKDYQAYLKDNDIQVSLLSEARDKIQAFLGKRLKVFIADPNEFLVLSYEADAKAADIFHDIGFLLHVDEKKNG